MNEKKLTPLMYLHLTLMIVLLLTDLVMVILLLYARTHPIFADYLRDIPTDGFATVVYVMNIAALVSGVIYLIKRCRKEAVGFYRSFMLCAACSCLLYGISMANQLAPEAATEPGMHRQYAYAVALAFVKCTLLLILTFRLNLGRRWSWIVFACLPVLDVVCTMASFRADHVWYLRVVALLSWLLMDTTLGLIIAEKYSDKAKRGAF